MAVNRIEQKGGASDAGGAKEAKPAESSGASAAPGGKGGSSWLPLLLNLVLMPGIAYALTTLVIVPKLSGSQKSGAIHSEKAAASEGSAASGGGETKAGKDEPGAKTKVVVPLSQKIVVNIKDTLGSRYLMAQMSLVGKGENFKNLVEKNDPQLRDAAGTMLSAKTIADLDKQGARNIIKAELLSTFNTVLGDNAVLEIYLTDFAIQ
jgi:flagellar FliL protein